VQGLFNKTGRPNRYLWLRTTVSRSGGSDQREWGRGVWAAAMARRRALPWRRLTGDGRSRPSGPHFERDQALEVERDTVNTSRHSRKLIRAWVGAPNGEGGAGSRHRGKLARADGKEKGEGARRGPYHLRVLRRRLEAEDRWCRGRIAAVQGGSVAAHPRLRATTQRRKGTGRAGRCSGS
jgi:hypothetical protein